MATARHLANHSYDVPTLIGHLVTFKDGCEGIISRSGNFAMVRSLKTDPHRHQYEMAWPTVAWEYIDKARRFPND